MYNTIVNDDSSGKVFNVHTDYTLTATNNIFVNFGSLGTITNSINNLVTATDPGFTNRSNYDYTLTSSATDAINKGTFLQPVSLCHHIIMFIQETKKQEWL